MVVIVMGVSGCGKTTVGLLLSTMLGVPFFDADTFHTRSNVALMKAGKPLTDKERLPWLQNLATHISTWEQNGGAVLACSALTDVYRRILSKEGKSKTTFVYLHGSKELIAKRMEKRSNHYMPVSLLNSQFIILEPPTDAIVMSIEDEPEVIAQAVANRLKKTL